jgi:hypothetical protein
MPLFIECDSDNSFKFQLFSLIISPNAKHKTGMKSVVLDGKVKIDELI